MDNETAAARPRKPSYIRVVHRAHLELTLGLFGIWFPFWMTFAVVAGISNWRARKRYERSLIEWALGLSAGAQVVVLCEATRPDLVPVSEEVRRRAA